MPRFLHFLIGLSTLLMLAQISKQEERSPFGSELQKQILQSGNKVVNVSIDSSNTFQADIDLISWVPFFYDIAITENSSRTTLVNGTGVPSCYLQGEEAYLFPKTELQICNDSASLASSSDSLSQEDVWSEVDSDLKGDLLLVKSSNHMVWLLQFVDHEKAAPSLKVLFKFNPFDIMSSYPKYSQVAFSQSTDYFYYITESFMLQFQMNLEANSFNYEIVFGFESESIVNYAYEFNGFMFLAAGKDGIHIYDIRDPKEISLAFRLDSNFFNRESVDCVHFAINSTLIHDATPDSPVILGSQQHQNLGEEQNSGRYTSTSFLKLKTYSGEYLVVSDLENGVHFVDITDIETTGPVPIPKILPLDKASAVARNQEVLYLLGENEDESAVYEVFMTESDLHSKAGSDLSFSEISHSSIYKVNRVIKQENIQDIFVDEKYLWMLSPESNQAIINSVNSTFLPSVSSIRRPFSRDGIASAQKVFIYGQAYLLSIGNGTIFIDQIITLPPHISCLFSEVLLNEYSGNFFEYSADIYTVHCLSQTFLVVNPLDYICQFHYTIGFSVDQSLIQYIFEDKFEAFFYTIIGGLVVATVILGLWAISCFILDQRMVGLRQKYDRLRESGAECASEDSMMKPQQEKPEVELESDKLPKRKKREDQEGKEFGIDDQPAEYNKDLYK